MGSNWNWSLVGANEIAGDLSYSVVKNTEWKVDTQSGE